MQTEDDVDLFSKPALTTEAGPNLKDGRTPRGLTPGGWVRTTGWLQVGDHPVSSALLAAVVGLLGAVVVAAALVGTHPVAAGVLVLTTPVVCGGAWWLFTTRLKPASPARNIGTTPADELAPGDNVRLFGSIGPVGRVAAVAIGEDVEVDFHGGARQSWPRDRTVHLVRLLG
ncbi:hypothetical protein SAMN04488564_11286 [Lentzea waywayandensis]|uniref:Uncharacterized protein n=1 Tax=Lentzea waywayandensis TaxID=84724 RepID=A0A1I6FDB9_9PSEU|nr:hypothetical protein [Lentzea waywayandensis]SFR27975.1 hypothetical protein SAMN04488564_11286 [Lentzea waywayandensis]